MYNQLGTTRRTSRFLPALAALALTLALAAGAGYRFGLSRSTQAISDQAAISYDSFRHVALKFQRDFLPAGFTLISPQDGLDYQVTVLPTMSIEERETDTWQDNALQPMSYNLYYYRDPGIVLQVTLIYTPYSTGERLIHYSVLRDGLTNSFPPSMQNKVSFPYMIQGMLQQHGYMIRFTGLSADPTLPESETAPRVSIIHDQVARALDQFAVSINEAAP